MTLLLALAAVTIYTEAAPAGAVLTTLQAEVSDIFGQSGLTFDWRPLATAGIPVDELVVVKFQGDCRVDARPTLIKPDSVALGSTAVSDGAVLPFIAIHCDAVHSLLRHHVHSGEKGRAFGLALARVLAHELYHVFARTIKHSKRGGIAQPYYSADDLLGASFEFTERDFELMRKGRATVLVAGGGD